MAGKPAHPRDTETLHKLKRLLAHGLTVEEAGRSLGMSRATAYRILNAAAYHPRGRRR